MAKVMTCMNAMFAQFSQGWQCLMRTLHGNETMNPLTLSNKNKVSQGKQKEIAMSRAQSFAQIGDDMSRMEELLRQEGMRLQGEPGNGVLWSRDNAYAQVFGPERPGRIREVFGCMMMLAGNWLMKYHDAS
ncbi:hypothetical protein CFP56_032295 [Quercus suber]|uniref:Uncharacterized protein n=1 Tax=Quercus suber TaxID=58331 RepID=A0AAW0JIR9_QUESU